MDGGQNDTTRQNKHKAFTVLLLRLIKKKEMNEVEV